MNDISAPSPTNRENAKVINTGAPATEPYVNRSALSVTLVAAGGGGMNLGRFMANNIMIKEIVNFDTSDANARPGEKVNVLSSGNGAGSDRAAVARDVERGVTQLTDEELRFNDVMIVVFTLAGGSGSTAAPYLLREYLRRGIKAIGICIADVSSSIAAKNTKNTLKTLNALAVNNDLELPLIVLSNDLAGGRGNVDKLFVSITTDLVNILTQPVYEVDRNDRFNWLSPRKVVGTQAGLRLVSVFNDQRAITSKGVLGQDSTEMVDSTLILQNTVDERPDDRVANGPTRLKKSGLFIQNQARLVGRVSSDISSINAILDQVTKAEQAEKAQTNSTVDRLSDGLTGGSDIFL